MTARFSIVTAAREPSQSLQRSLASVAEQPDATVEHLVVIKGQLPADAAPANSCRMLAQTPQATGLYGALNQGLEAARGDLLAWLNDDEQYLPGTLEFVRRYFDEHPDVDLLFGDFLVVDERGRLLAFRKGSAPRRAYMLSAHLYVFSCTLFFRRRIWDAGLRFNSAFRSAGDMDFVVRVLQAGFRARHVPRYFSTFTWSGNNLSAGQPAHDEELRIRAAAPAWARCLRWPFNLARWTEKALSGAYQQAWPLEYQIYLDDLTRRTTLTAAAGSWRWPQR